jgi:hypothetical protein
VPGMPATTREKQTNNPLQRSGILMSTHTTTMTSIRHSVARRRVARRDRRRLERELASYRSPSERRELDAIIGRHTADETRTVEAILHRQAEKGTTRGCTLQR